jgi:hypothetical protein
MYNAGVVVVNPEVAGLAPGYELRYLGTKNFQTFRHRGITVFCKMPVGRRQQEFYAMARRVARWHILNPKIPIWVNFGGSCNQRFYGHSILRPFGIL